MTVYEAIMNRRTIRKFKQEKLNHNDLVELVDCARMAPYGINLQPLKFKIAEDEDLLKELFKTTAWAGMIKDGAPKENERPVAYIAILGDTQLKKSFDADAATAAVTMIYAAYEKGIASCWLGAIDRHEIKRILNIGDRYEVMYLVAFGYPAQKSKAVEAVNGDTKYYLDDEGVVNIPKRPLDEVLL